MVCRHKEGTKQYFFHRSLGLLSEMRRLSYRDYHQWLLLPQPQFLPNFEDPQSAGSSYHLEIICSSEYLFLTKLQNIVQNLRLDRDDQLNLSFIQIINCSNKKRQTHQRNYTFCHREVMCPEILPSSTSIGLRNVCNR